MLNAPFVAEGSTMEAIIARDETRVKDLGQSNKKIGSLLAVLRGLTDKVNQFDWGGRSYKVRLVSGRVVQVTNTATDQTFSFRVEHPELVYLYGFYGDPKTKSRIEPEKIVEFFGLK